MAFSWQIFLVMIVLGVLQLALGVALGRWLPARVVRRQRRVDATERSREQRRLRYFADRLTSLMQGVAGEVGAHRHRIDQLNRELVAAGGEDDRSVTEFVLGAMTRIVQINERLQSRLTMAEQRLQEQTEQIQTHFAEARTDPLTGLMNRRALDDAMRAQMTACRRGQGAFSLVMADVDHFKRVNDSHGHPAGDDLLCALSRQFEELISGSGMVARYGGEEFALLMPAIQVREAQARVERIRTAIAQREFLCDGHRLSLTVSLGLAATQRVDEDEFDVLRRADEALYTAKRAGRNCSYFNDGHTCYRIGGEAIDPRDPDAEQLALPDHSASRVGPDNEPSELDAVTEPLEAIRDAVREELDRLARPPADAPVTTQVDSDTSFGADARR